MSLEQLIKDRDHASAMVGMYLSLGDFMNANLWMQREAILNKKIKEAEDNQSGQADDVQHFFHFFLSH